MTKLTFKNSKTLRGIVQHTLDADKYSNPYSAYPEMETILHIDLVKDSGIYIMSGASENYKSGKGEGSSVSYAVGYNPKTNQDCYEDSRIAVGGDDFCDPIEMTKEQLERVVNGGSIVIEMTDDTITVTA